MRYMTHLTRHQAHEDGSSSEAQEAPKHEAQAPGGSFARWQGRPKKLHRGVPEGSLKLQHHLQDKTSQGVAITDVAIKLSLSIKRNFNTAEASQKGACKSSATCMATCWAVYRPPLMRRFG